MNNTIMVIMNLITQVLSRFTGTTLEERVVMGLSNHLSELNSMTIPSEQASNRVIDFYTELYNLACEMAKWIITTRRDMYDVAEALSAAKKLCSTVLTNEEMDALRPVSHNAEEKLFSAYDASSGSSICYEGPYECDCYKGAYREIFEAVQEYLNEASYSHIREVISNAFEGASDPDADSEYAYECTCCNSSYEHLCDAIESARILAAYDHFGYVPPFDEDDFEYDKDEDF